MGVYHYKIRVISNSFFFFFFKLYSENVIEDDLNFMYTKMQNAQVKEYFLTENNKRECKVYTEQNLVTLAGNVSHLKNHLHSKHKNIAIELGILETRRVRNNNHNEDNGEENTVSV